MARQLRILALLLLLFSVAVTTWLTRERTTSWEQPLRVAVFPINADARPATAAYIADLDEDDFTSIAEFFAVEAERYDLTLSQPVQMFLAPPLSHMPPPPPADGRVLKIMLWSLQLRYWAWKHGDFDRAQPHVRIFMLYHDPASVDRVGHSLGLQKGLIGVVHAFASLGQADQNYVVLAHEILHTVGASDKYDPATGLPLHPTGYAEPERRPLLPQEFAEIMGGRVPLSPSGAEMPDSLDQVLIGEATALEIRWIR